MGKDKRRLQHQELNFWHLSVAKSEHGGRHSLKDEVLPVVHKWTWLLGPWTKFMQVINTGLHLSLPHSRLFHNAHIFWWSLFCMLKLTMCNKLDHNSASHMLASINFIPKLVLTSCGFINLGGCCLSCWKWWYNKIEVCLSFLIEYCLESFIFKKNQNPWSHNSSVVQNSYYSQNALHDQTYTHAAFIVVLSFVKLCALME
jgi:hypothetical protein